MKPLKILIVEDELITANDIKETLEKAGHEIIAITQSSKEAISILKHSLPDLALIDITLEDSTLDGIDTAKALLMETKIPIIYLTANSETPTVQRAAETYPAAYLLKPFRHKELAIQVELAYHNYQGNKGLTANPLISESLYFPFEGGHVRIKKSNVLYIKAEGSYVMIFEVNSERLFAMNLGYLVQFFSTPNFYRLSRSYLVNLDYVERIENSQLVIQGAIVPFSEKQYKDVIRQLAVVKTRYKTTHLD